METSATAPKDLAPTPTNEVAVVGAVVGAFALLLSLIPFIGVWVFWIPGAVALVLGLVGLRIAKKYGPRRSLALTAIGLALASVLVTGGWFFLGALLHMFVEH